MNKLQIDLDLPANKLQKGYGDGVCQVLEKLCSISIQNKFRFKTPKIAKDTQDVEQDDGDDDGMDDGADVHDMAN
jgi:hypothetical protein